MNSPKIFQGWYVVIACFFVTMCMGETLWSFGVFFKPLQAEFGWSRALVSSGYMMYLITYSLSGMVAGRLSDRYGPRLILLASGILSGLGICMCSRVQSVNEFRFFLFVAGLGAGATWAVPTSIVQRWFYGRPRAGLALSIVVSGIGIGALVFTPLINFLILNYGWRNTYLILGILFLMTIVFAVPLVKRSPREIQYAGDGSISMQRTPGLTTAEALTHSSFLILTFATCITCITFQVLSVHLFPFVTDIGMRPTIAAAAIGLMGAVSIPGRILAGPLSDRIGWKRTIATAFFGMTLAAIWLQFLRTEWMLYSFAVLFGLFWGARSTSLTGAIGSFFGMRSLGELIGINAGIANISSAFAPYIAGYIFDTFGSYRMIFFSLAFLLLFASVLTTIIRKPVIRADGTLHESPIRSGRKGKTGP